MSIVCFPISRMKMSECDLFDMFVEYKREFSFDFLFSWMISTLMYTSAYGVVKFAYVMVCLFYLFKKMQFWSVTWIWDSGFFFSSTFVLNNFV